jgi:hypothetical protein
MRQRQGRIRVELLLGRPASPMTLDTRGGVHEDTVEIEDDGVACELGQAARRLTQ